MPHSSTEYLLFRFFPGYRARAEIYDDLLRTHLKPEGIWLDIGCGANEHISTYGHNVRLAAGVDRVDHGDRMPGLFVMADVRVLPFADACADLITLRMVVEHLPGGDDDFREIERVLKPGGTVIVLTTNAASPVILLPRILPTTLKMRIIRRIFGVNDVDIFPTYHRFNTARRMKQGAGSLTLTSLHFLEQVSRQASFPLFLPFFLWYGLTAFDLLAPLRSNIIAAFEKKRGTLSRPSGHPQDTRCP